MNHHLALAMNLVVVGVVADVAELAAVAVVAAAAAVAGVGSAVGLLLVVDSVAAVELRFVGFPESFGLDSRRTSGRSSICSCCRTQMSCEFFSLFCSKYLMSVTERVFVGLGFVSLSELLW